MLTVAESRSNDFSEITNRAFEDGNVMVGINVLCLVELNLRLVLTAGQQARSFTVNNKTKTLLFIIKRIDHKPMNMSTLPQSLKF